MPRRPRLTRLSLWICVLTGGITLGAKLFDLRVLVGAWSASPPESLSLLPYGANYPVDTGEFFQPLGAALLVGLLGAAISGWKTPASYRLWLLIPFAMVLAGWILTVLWFWPLNAALWDVARGAPNAVQDRAEIIRMTRQWVICDWLRVAILAVSFVSSIRALSVPYPAPAGSAPSAS